jgi:CRISPR-associated protein (TIGR02584 family)
MQPAAATQIAGAKPAAERWRRVLLAVTGLTPQVVTETLYALWREQPTALPDEVHVLTTAEGAKRARLALLSEQLGGFARLRADYRLPPIAFDETHIHTLQSTDGQALSDIRSAEDNQAAADQIAEFVRRLTADPATALHVSLAGGRKTLGFFAGYALSLWGRTQDRLSHVLVSEPFESSWDFFYPTPYERIIQTRDGKIADCATAEVSLADIPFVRLRHGLPAELLDGRASFAQAVLAAQGHLGPPRLRIDLRGARVEAAGRAFELPPAELALLAWFARRAQRRLDALPCPQDGVPSAEHAQAYLTEYRRIRVFLDDDAATPKRYARGMTKADFEERKSKLKRALRAALGAAADPYLIVGEGRRPMRYRLALPAEAIRIDE